jgi:hypothetical protein
VNWSQIESEFGGFEQSSRELYRLQLEHYPETREEYDGARDQAIGVISPDSSASEGIEPSLQFEREFFADRVSSLTGSHVRARIEGQLIENQLIDQESSAFQHDSFAQMVETALLKATNQQHVIRRLTEPMAAEIVSGFDRSTPLTEALEYIQYLSNKFHVDPVDERHFTGERLFWGMKDDGARELAEVAPEELFKKDLREFLCHVVMTDSFRRVERNELEQFCFIDDEHVDSAEYRAFTKECDAQIEQIIDQLCPIFGRHIENKAFVDLKGAASEIESLGAEASVLLTESILGYEGERHGERFFQPGTGAITLNSQLYSLVQPIDESRGYTDMGDRPSDQVTRYRFELAARMRQACERFDPDFESNPKFANVLRAFGVVAELVIPAEHRDGLREYAEEIAEIRARDGEEAAKLRMQEDIDRINAQG